MKILVPDNVNPLDWDDIIRFIECAGYELKDDIEETFQYLTEFTYGEDFIKGKKLFLITNTYSRYPGRKFIIGYNVDYIIGEPTKEYIVKEYRHF